MSPTENGIPEGFTPLDAAETDAPDFEIVEADRWRRGAVVVYRGLHKWVSALGDKRAAHTIQRAGDADGTLYGIWSTAELDRLLKQVATGEQVFLRYDGCEPHPTLAGRTLHRWTVALAHAPSPTPAKPAALPF